MLLLLFCCFLGDVFFCRCCCCFGGGLVGLFANCIHPVFGDIGGGVIC